MKGRLVFNMEENSKSKEIFEWIVCILIALIIVVLIKAFVGFPTVVSGASMDSTLKDKQRLWVSRIGIEIHKYPKRGDIITFEAPSTTTLSLEEKNESVIARYENEPTNIFSKFSYYVLELNKISYIKRVIGLPGDHILIEEGKVYVNGELLEESYLQPGVVTDNGKGYCTDLTVPENTVFAMGDNRTQSTDCRSFGCIPLEKIESKVWIRIWPLNLFGKIDK